MRCDGSRSRGEGLAADAADPEIAAAEVEADPEIDATRSIRARLLRARELREERIRELARGVDGSLVALSVSIPGPDKNLPGVDELLELGAFAFESAMAREGLSCRRLSGAIDPLGPWVTYASDTPAESVKSLCVGVEEHHPWGRLLDLDVYLGAAVAAVDARRDIDLDADLDAHLGDGVRSAVEPLRQAGRAQCGLPPRPCLVCGEPARECILVQRHSGEALLQRTAALLESARHAWRLRHLARALARGARAELDLTPKPGLVDRHDCGSHPDLSYAQMRRSIDLLEIYYRDLIEIVESATAPEAVPLLDESAWRRCLAAGRAAEARMLTAIGTNAHRGYIFLSGLVLLAAAEARSLDPADLRPAIRRLAAWFFDGGGSAAVFAGTMERPGQRVRRLERAGGIEAEARAGLPALFDFALPALADGRGPCGAMAALMLCLEDTTAIHRSGWAGLERIRRDGARLRAMISRGEDPVPHLAQWNDEYRAMGLTMGGVADCLALAMGLTTHRHSPDPIVDPVPGGGNIIPGIRTTT